VTTASQSHPLDHAIGAHPPARVRPHPQGPTYGQGASLVRLKWRGLPETSLALHALSSIRRSPPACLFSVVAPLTPLS
jgi:hypothetical protein